MHIMMSCRLLSYYVLLNTGKEEEITGRHCLSFIYSIISFVTVVINSGHWGKLKQVYKKVYIGFLLTPTSSLMLGSKKWLWKVNV